MKLLLADINDQRLRNWQIALLTYFAVFGVAGASIAVRLPLVRDLLGVSVSTLGILLFVGSVGSLLSLSLVGRFIAKYGTRRISIYGFATAMAAYIAQALMAQAGLPVFYAAFAFIAGFVIGASDVAINVDASTVEQKLGKSVLPRMHAAFSFGTLFGAAIGTAAAAANFPLPIQVALICAVGLALPLVARHHLPEGNGIEAEHTQADLENAAHSGVDLKHKITLGLVLLGLGIFGMTLGEGSSNDWLTLAIVDDYNESDTIAGVAYAVLLAAMAITRFFGGNLADRFGKANTLRLMALLGIAGILLIISEQSIVLALIGSALWGCGVALAFPLFISAAGEMPNPAKKVAFVSAAGYMAFLVGPPLLGFLGEAWGLLNMYWVITLFFVLTFTVAGAAGNHRASKSKSKK
jgi:MFS family permease